MSNYFFFFFFFSGVSYFLDAVRLTVSLITLLSKIVDIKRSYSRNLFVLYLNIAQLRGKQLTGGCYKVIDPIMEINKTEKLSL